MKFWITLINRLCYCQFWSKEQWQSEEKKSILQSTETFVDLWVRFMAVHLLHCYRREKVDWSSQTPETIIHSPQCSILFSRSTLVSIGLLFGPIKRNHCLPGPRSLCIPYVIIIFDLAEGRLAVYFPPMPGRWIVKKLNRGYLVLM